MKRKIISAAMIFTAVFFTGCFGGEEVSDRAFVQLLGLEKQDGIYTASLQIYKSESGTPEPDTSKANSFVQSGSGVTVQAALADAETAVGKKLFLGHIKMLVIGGGIENPADELALFLDGSVSPACPVVYSDDPAAVAGTLPKDGAFSAEQFMSLMEAASSQGKTVYTSVADLAADTGVLDCAAALPVVKAEDETIAFDGLTFARKNGTAGTLSEEDTLGVKLLLDGFEKGDSITVPVAADGELASAYITDAGAGMKVKINEGRLCVYADVKMKIDISENPYEIPEEQLEKAVEKTVRDSCISAFSTAVWYNSCDIFGIKKLVRRDCPDFYPAYCGDPDGFLSGSELTVTVSADII